MSRPLLQLIDVTRRFPAGDRDVVVLKDISISIDAGEIVAIVGASGSGKSTLMNILGCLDHPSAGSYRVGGRETRDLHENELARLRRERFGFIFQRYHLLPHLDAAANVEMPAIYAGSMLADRRARAGHLLARLGLGERAGHRPGQLSGGQQQRVSIARALMNGGEVILADEPTGALDSRSGQDVIRILRELNALGHTVIIVTHDERVAAHTRRIVEIHDGEIVADRPNTPVADLRDAAVSVAPSPAGVAASAAVTPADIASSAGATAPCADCSALPPPRAHRRPESVGRFAESFRMAWLALMAHRLRTILTMLGITIGIMSVVSIVAIGEGAKRHMLDEITRIGTNTIDIYPGLDMGDSQADKIQTLVPTDVIAIAEQPYVDSATPETSRNLLLRYRNIDVTARVSGVGELYFQVNGMTFAQGIGFSPDALHSEAQVAVIDQNTRRRLFGTNPSPLGEVILVDNLPCIVIGVTADKSSAFGDTKSLNVWVPFTTAGSRLFGQRSVDRVIVRVRDGQPSETAENNLVKLMTQRHGRKDFFTYNMDSVVKTAEKIGRSLTLLLSLIAVISLAVGGIGVMNIMLVSVTERTREIGIRMAVGARQGDIMLQFLVEAVMVCLMGGTIGIALSLGTPFVFSLFVSQWNMVFSVHSIIAAFLCSTLIGIAFGFVPARNAARLDPIDSLARD